MNELRHYLPVLEEAFDRDWYLLRYPDVADAGVDPLEHYLRFGAVEGRDPNPFFNTSWYVEQNRDVREAGIHPFVHFLSAGSAEGRKPNPLIPANIATEAAPSSSKVSTGDFSEDNVFNAFWHGPPLTALHRTCLNSFIGQGEAVRLYVYEEVDVPPGVEIRDAREVIPAKDVYFFANKELGRADVGPFSDLFRFKLLWQRGGWWVDTDVFCMRKIPRCDYAWAAEEQLPSEAIGTSQLRLPKESLLALELYRACSALFSHMTYREQIGPHLITHILGGKVRPTGHLGSTETFYPVKWIEAIKLWLPEFYDQVAARTKRALFVPCWASLGSYIGLDQNKPPPIGSFLDAVARRSRWEFHESKPYTAVEIRQLLGRWLKERIEAQRELVSATSAEFVLQLVEEGA